jgi:uncharacterized protein (DUF1697 family)
MTRFAVFIRAVNVGGRSVKMGEVTRTLAQNGLESVSSFRQSGNLVISSSITDIGEIGLRVKEQLDRLTGLAVEIFPVPMEKLSRLVDAAPFEGRLSEGDRGFVTFMSSTPSVSPKMPLTLDNGIILIGLDQNMALSIVRKEVGSGPSNDLIERRFGVRATTRNWTTVKGLVEREVGRNED